MLSIQYDTIQYNKIHCNCCRRRRRYNVIKYNTIRYVVIVVDGGGEDVDGTAGERS